MPALLWGLLGLVLGLVIAGFAGLYLVRWLSPRLGVSGPSEFFSLMVHDVLPARNSTFATLERKISRQLTGQRLTMSSGQTFAFGSITIRLSPRDRMVLVAMADESVLITNFETVYLTHARKEGWTVPRSGRVAIALSDAPSLPLGAVSISGVLGSGYDSEPDDQRAQQAGAQRAGAHNNAPDASTTPAVDNDSLATEQLIGSDDETVEERDLPTTPYQECRLLVSGDGGSTSFSSLNGDVVIGRDKSADYALAAPGVSRRHALLRHSSLGWQAIPNAQAKNGVFIDGARVDNAVAIAERTRIGLGRESFIDVVPECTHAAR